MTVLTTIPNGASNKDVRDTINQLLTDVAALKAGGGTVTPAPTLTLTGPLTYATNAAAGTLVANIGNVPTGVTPTITPNDGRLVVAGSAGAWTVVKGGSASTAGTITLAVAASGATGATATVTVTAAPALPTGRVASYRPPSTGTNGAAVTSYPESVNGYNAVAASGQEPTYVANALGGKPGLQFGGGKRSNIANASSPALASVMASRTFSIFMCVKNVDSTTGFAALLGFNTDTLLMIQSGGNNGFLNEFGFNNGGATRLGAPALDNGFHVIGLTQSANFHGSGYTLTRLWIDGAVVAVTINGTNQDMPSITTDLTFGAVRNSDGAFPCSYINLGADVYDSDVGHIGAAKIQKDFAALYSQALPYAGASKFYVTLTNSIGAGVGADRDYYGFVPYLFGPSGLNLSYGRYSNGGFPAATCTILESYAAAEFDGLAAVLGIPVVMVAFEGRNTIATIGGANGPIAQADQAAAQFQTLLQNRINAGITRIAAATIGDVADSSTQILTEYASKCAAIPAALTGASLVSMTRWDQDQRLGIGTSSTYPEDYSQSPHQTGKANYPTTESGQARMALVVMKSAVQAL